MFADFWNCSKRFFGRNVKKLYFEVDIELDRNSLGFGTGIGIKRSERDSGSFGSCTKGSFIFINLLGLGLGE